MTTSGDGVPVMKALIPYQVSCRNDGMMFLQMADLHGMFVSAR
jgi:hypothetical protein